MSETVAKSHDAPFSESEVDRLSAEVDRLTGLLTEKDEALSRVLQAGKVIGLNLAPLAIKPGSDSERKFTRQAVTLLSHVIKSTLSQKYPPYLYQSLMDDDSFDWGSLEIKHDPGSHHHKEYYNYICSAYFGPLLCSE